MSLLITYNPNDSDEAPYKVALQPFNGRPPKAFRNERVFRQVFTEVGKYPEEGVDKVLAKLIGMAERGEIVEHEDRSDITPELFAFLISPGIAE